MPNPKVYVEENNERAQFLQSLKQDLRKILPAANVHEYEPDLLDHANTEIYLERLGADISEALRSVILSQMARARIPY